MDTLIAITTYNQIQFTVRCLYSILRAEVCADVVVFDDASTDGTDTIPGYKVITKPEGRGLTDSWNMAYRYFKNNGYEYFFLFNNDIIVPKGAIENMTAVLKDHAIVVPLTSKRGARGFQNVNSYHVVPNPEKPENYQKVQDSLFDKNPVPLKSFNGFAFAMNRNIIRYELPDGNLFDPANINVGNEDDLNARIVKAGGKAALCTKAFIYHFKDSTFRYQTHKVHRDNLKFYRCEK